MPFVLVLFHSARVSRIDRQRLCFLGLAALQEIAETCALTPAPKAPWLRALLGLLWLQAGARENKRWLFTTFWEAATAPPCSCRGKPGRCADCSVRRGKADSALNGICRELGWEPTVTFLGHLEASRRAGEGLAEG